MRCFRCQKFGHVRDKCSGEQICDVCCKAVHEGPCQGPALCVNCGGSHPSSSRDCPKWQLEKSIQKVKTEKKIPFSEAKKLVVGSQSMFSMSYASAAKKTSTVSVCCQTDLSFAPRKEVKNADLASSGGVKPANSSSQRAPGGGNKSTTSQTTQQIKPAAGGSVKPVPPPPPPRPSELKAKRSGGGKGKVELVEMAKRPPPSPSRSQPAGQLASRSGDPSKDTFLKVSNPYSVLQVPDEDTEMD